MQFLLQTSCLLICSSLWIQQANGRSVLNTAEGYYWRDYTGTIPPDAFPGGKDKDGQITYIGQTVHRSAILIPGKIIPKKQKMHYEFGRLEYTTDEDIKILCTQHPEKMEWIKTNSEEIVNGLYDKHLIVGGHEIGYRVLIGRVLVDGQLHIGKVHTIDNEYTGIHITENGKGWQESEFEVLSFNDDASEKNRIEEDLRPPEPSKMQGCIKNGARLISGSYLINFTLLWVLYNILGYKFL